MVEFTSTCTRRSKIKKKEFRQYVKKYEGLLDISGPYMEQTAAVPVTAVTLALQTA